MPPSPSASQPASNASAPAPTVGAPQSGAPEPQGASDAPSAVPDGPSGASTDFAAAAASAIAAAAASSSDAGSAASHPQDKASPDSAAVPFSGTAPTTESIDDEGNDEDEDGEYDPTASQYVPGVQAQSFGGGELGPPPQTRPTADQGSGESLKLEHVALLSTADVLTTHQPNGHSSGEAVGPPAVKEQAAPLAVENESSAASGVLPESAGTADTASVVAAPPPVAVAGAAVSDAVALGAVGTESAASQPESFPPAATSSPNEPQPPNGAPPTPVDVEEPLPSPPGVVSASAGANSQPRASTPPLSSAAEREMDAQMDASQSVHPPSPPIGSSSGQEPLPESVEIESEDVRRFRPPTCLCLCLLPTVVDRISL